MATARLFYVVGASGAGKDSILRSLRDNFISQCDLPVVIAHRYITRASDKNEQAVCLSTDEFSLRKAHQLFALDWQANGFSYGIGKEVNQWLAAGVSVIVNGSRGYMNTAKSLYPESLYSINIHVSEDILLKRLENRSRETEAAINDRMLRHQQLKDVLVSDSIIVNEATIDNAAQQFKKIIDNVQQNKN